MMGTVFIKDLLVRCYIGTTEKEKECAQNILINVELTADVVEAAASDDLEKTVDYTPVYRHILELAKTSRFNLIETLASAITNYSLSFNPRVEQVIVKIEKPHRLDSLQSVGIEITRTRE